jgi:hypothetical protein
VTGRKSCSALAALLFGGCATLVNGTEETFHVDTVPAGATVTTTIGGGNSAYACAATPCGFNVSRKATFVATVTKPGYHPVRVVVRNSEFKRLALDDLGVETASSEHGDADTLKSLGGNIGAATAAQAAVLNVDPITSAVFGSTSVGLAVGQTLIIAAPAAIVTDSATGSLNKLYPNPIRLRLIPDTEPIESIDSVRRLTDDPSLFIAAQPVGSAPE